VIIVVACRPEFVRRLQCSCVAKGRTDAHLCVFYFITLRWIYSCKSWSRCNVHFFRYCRIIRCRFKSVADTPKIHFSAYSAARCNWRPSVLSSIAYCEYNDAAEGKTSEWG